MSWAQAFAYFVREAGVGLLRGWRTSLLAILTIAISLFLTGVFLLLSTNLEALVAGFRQASRLTAYLEEATTTDALARIAGEIESVPWVLAAVPVDAEAARDRFVSAYPSMADLLEGFEESPLPSSVEIEVDWSAIDPSGSDRVAYLRKIDAWTADPDVSHVDDDRDWLAQLEAIALVLRGLAVVVAGVLVTTAVFTIASVIRLAAHQHRDEISVLRMVGATEFFIRGPFYFEGLIQGVLGGLLAVVTLGAGFVALRSNVGEGLLADLATGHFLPPSWLAALIGVGAFAGLVGAIVSLGREQVDSERSDARWIPEGEASA